MANVQYEVEINGRVRQVAVQRAGCRFLVSVDGREWLVDAVRIDAHTLSLLIDEAVRLEPDTMDRTTRSHEAIVVPDAASGQLSVRVHGAPLTVSVNGRRRRRPSDDAGQAGSAPQRICAPMPGKVVRLLVKRGDAVRARQPLIVIEAMKMENELRAGRDGVVAEIQVQGGQSVEAGAVLAVIAPA